jgi:DNA modification methylase
VSWQVIEGDCLSVLRTLDAGSVQTCVTSPPYWGLRDYGTAIWEGGDPDCDHPHPKAGDIERNLATSTLVGTGQSHAANGPGAACGKCGAKRVDSQLGLEPTPEEYVANLVEVFREVRRVLRDDGTVWLNLGDSYASSSTYNTTNSLHTKHGWKQDGERRPNAYNVPGLKPKDLVGIPWRVAFALQADGWWLRSDIIWSKPNPMPESVTDRPTRSHEYIFLLSKSARYFYDAVAIREDASRGYPFPGGGVQRHHHGNGHEGLDSFAVVDGGRNRRSVWTVTTQPYPEAHFATFPPKLVEPCILAGSPPQSATVLDPFCGSGTTGVVALRHNRDFIGVELNPTYAEMARNRIRDDAPLMNHGSEVAA